MGVPGPEAGELNQEFRWSVQWSQCLPEPGLELELQPELKQEFDLLAAQEVEAGWGLGLAGCKKKSALTTTQVSFSVKLLSIKMSDKHEENKIE